MGERAELYGPILFLLLLFGHHFVSLGAGGLWRGTPLAHLLAGCPRGWRRQGAEWALLFLAVALATFCTYFALLYDAGWLSPTRLPPLDALPYPDGLPLFRPPQPPPRLINPLDMDD